jgi:hypothetical protein
MKLSSSVRLVLVLVAAVSVTAATRAQSAAFAVLNKNRNYVQTGAVTTQALASGGFSFAAQIDGTATTPSSPVSFTVPAGGGVRALSFAADRQQWLFEQRFDTTAALNAAFPNGSYTYTFGGRTASLNFNGDLYPAAPVATVSTGTWNGGTLTVDRAQPLTLTITFPLNFSAGASRLAITVGGAADTPGNFSADTVATGFTQSQLTLTVPANSLTAGGAYTVQLEANRIASLDATGVPGYNTVAIYSATTTFSLRVAFTGPPVFSQQPANVQIANNSTVVFGANAQGATSYQWRKNGVALVNETGPTLVLFGATNADVGTYSVVASNASGSVPSLPANLTIATGFDFGRLTNLSILTDLTATTQSFTLGTVIGGTGTVGAKPLLIRAVGPSLGQLIGPGALPDAKLELYAGQTVVATNDDWAGAAALTTAFSQVGAFSFTDAASKDAAIFLELESRAGGYTAVVSAAPGATGRVIAEFYDATSAIGFRANTPRLVNVSVSKQIDAGSSLTAGFVIGGSTAKTVLVRAIGPGLGVFGVPGVMADPRLDLFNASSVRIAANDNWGGEAQLTAAGARVGAFEIANRQSADAILLVTLVPGNYSAEVRGTNGGGTALVEVYEVP